MGNNWHSLSHQLTNSTPVFPGDPTVLLQPHCTVASHGCAVTTLQLSSHSGTHVDSSAHISETGVPLAAIPRDRFITTAVIANITSLAAPQKAITAAALASLLPPSGISKTLLLATGWDQHWHTPAATTHPFFTPDCAVLLKRQGYHTIGFDTMSPDSSHSTTLDFHREYLGESANLIIENLTGLSSLFTAAPHPAAVFEFIFLPLHTAAPDGAPVTAVARALAS